MDKRERKTTYAAIAALFLAAALVLAFGFWGTQAGVAFAEASTFDAIFPTRSYFQAVSPKYIAANDGYLAVYDPTDSTLYVRSTDVPNYHYELATETVKGVYLLESVAFIEAEGEHYYTLDLTDPAASAQSCTLENPQHITSFSSDGTHLYAKSSGGWLSIYDQSLQVAYEADNLYSEEALAGKAAIAGKDGKLYLFLAEEGAPKLYVYDAATKQLTLNVSSLLIQSAQVGDVVYAQISDDETVENRGKIALFDLETGAQLNLETDIEPDSFAAYGDKLYSIEGNRILVYALARNNAGQDDETYSLTCEETISMAGNDMYHLSSPSDVALFDGRLAVADSQNNRVLYIDPSNGVATKEDKLPSPVKRVTADGSGVYALLDGQIVKCFGDRQQSFDIKAKDLVYSSELYVLTDSNICVLLQGAFHNIVQISGGRLIATAEGGSALYALTDSEIFMYTKSGVKLPTSLTGDFAKVKDMAVDYAGNILLLYGDKVELYANRASSLSLSSAVEFSNPNVSATANSALLVGSTLYFTADECLVGKTSVETVTEQTFVPAAPEVGGRYHFARLKEGGKAYYIPSDGRADSLGAIPADATLLALDDVSAPEGLIYALWEDRLVAVPAEEYAQVDPTAKSGTYRLKKDETLRAIPYFDEGAIDLDKDTHVTLVSDCANYNSNIFAIIAYGERTYFVPADSIEEYNPAQDVDPPAENAKKNMGRAKAKRVGGLVGIYSDMRESETLLEIVDGTKVEVLETYDAYYMVKYEDKVGYMRKKEVKLDGLTTVQIAAIVIACLVVVAGAGVFVAIYLTKKKQDEAQN